MGIKAWDVPTEI